MKKSHLNKLIKFKDKFKAVQNELDLIVKLIEDDFDSKSERWKSTNIASEQWDKVWTLICLNIDMYDNVQDITNLIEDEVNSKQ